MTNYHPEHEGPYAPKPSTVIELSPITRRERARRHQRLKPTNGISEGHSAARADRAVDQHIPAQWKRYGG